MPEPPAFALLSLIKRADQIGGPKGNSADFSKNPVGSTGSTGDLVSQITVAVKLWGRARIRPCDIIGVGITNQRETTIVWDRKTGDAVYNAIVWQDRRTAGICDKTPRRRSRQPNLKPHRSAPGRYFSGTKIAWILDNVPGARARAESGDLPLRHGRYLADLELTSGHNVHVTDPSNASRTLLYNIHTADGTRNYSSFLTSRRVCCPRSVLRAKSTVKSAPPLGLQKVPIAGIAGDQQAALVGQMCVHPGQAKNNLRHRLLPPAKSRLQADHLHQSSSDQRGLPDGKKREFVLEGSVFIGGAVVQWLRDGLQLVRSAKEVDLLAESTLDNGGVYLVPAFTGLGAPHWDPYARGAIIGITRGPTAAHISRAALEGIAYQVADLIDAMQADTGKRLKEIKGRWRCQP